MSTVRIAGAATTTFGRHMDSTLADLSKNAVRAALDDAGMKPDQVDAVVFSNAAEGVLRGQEMIRAQVSLRDSGLDGLPMFNTENACASGSSAVHLAWNMLLAGRVGTVLVVGAEKLHHEDKQRSFDAIESGVDRSLPPVEAVQGSVMMSSYAEEANAYAESYGDVDEALTAIAIKNRDFASRNDFAQFRTPITTADVASSRMVAPPLRLLMCSPLTDGAAALVMTTSADAQGPTLVSSHVSSHATGQSVVEMSVRRIYEETGSNAGDFNVFQLHDASAIAELLQYEQIGLAPVGKARELILDGRTGFSGDRPVNTDGGLMSRGHALGATGVAQIVELTRQLRGIADGRQIEGATSALAVNAGGWMGHDYATCVATMLVAGAN
nr:thiolase family protein [Rhodococcus sp. (in: high G+C Gram-positive bacteria)]